MEVSKLYKLMKIKKISQRELAKLTGINQTTISYILRGNDMKVSTLEKIAKALDVPISYFFDESQEIGKINIQNNANGSNNQMQIQINEQSERIHELEKENEKLKAELDGCKKLIETKDHLISILEKNCLGNS